MLLLPFKVWEEFEKIQPDGTKKRFLRRYISTCNVILKKPSSSKSSESDVQYEEVEIDEDNPNDDVFDPNVSFFVGCFLATKVFVQTTQVFSVIIPDVTFLRGFRLLHPFLLRFLYFLLYSSIFFFYFCKHTLCNFSL